MAFLGSLFDCKHEVQRVRKRTARGGHHHVGSPGRSRCRRRGRRSSFTAIIAASPATPDSHDRNRAQGQRQHRPDAAPGATAKQENRGNPAPAT